MANRSFVVQYIIQARERYVATANKVSAATARMLETLRKYRRENALNATNLKKTSEYIKKHKVAFLAAAGSVAFGFMKLVNAGSNFEESVADLSAITGATGKDLTLLKTRILEMSRSYVASQGEVATAIKLVASAKPELLDNIGLLTKTTESVLLLKNASGMELAEASKVVAESLNQFGRGAEYANKFVNILAAGAKFGSSEIAQTGQASTIAGPAARAAGLDFLQLNAAIQTVAKGGIKGAQAGTALNAIFGRLRRQGIDFKKLGLEGSFLVVKKALDAVKDSTTRAKMEAQIFGEEHAKVGLALLSNAKFLGEYERKLKGTNVAQEQAGIRMGILRKAAASAGILLNEKFIRVYEKITPMLKRAANSMTSFIASMDPGDIEVISMTISGLGTILIALMDIVSMVANTILTVLKPVFALFKGLGAFIGQFSAALISLDFSKFDLSGAFDIGGKTLGLFGGESPALAKPPTMPGSNVNVGVNVGLDKGLIQTTPTAVSTTGTRRTDVGMLPAY